MLGNVDHTHLVCLFCGEGGESRLIGLSLGGGGGRFHLLVDDMGRASFHLANEVTVTNLLSKGRVHYHVISIYSHVNIHSPAATRHRPDSPSNVLS